MFMVSELMAAEQVPEKDGDLEEEDFLPLTIQGLYFNRFEAPAGLLGRYSDLLFFRPYEQQHQKSSNWLDTRALFKQATGMDPFEFLAVGAVVLAHFLRFRTPKDLATRRYQLPVTALISRLYSVPESDVLLVEFPPANAFKATIPRLHGSGAVEDSDVYGAQQHGPLMDVELPI